MTQEEQGQTLVEGSEATQRVTGKGNDTDTCLRGASEGDAEKSGQKTDSVQSIEDRKMFETKEEKPQFIRESFQLDANTILNADANKKKCSD